MFKNKKIVLTILLIFIVSIISFFIGMNIQNKNTIQKQLKEVEKLAETSEENSYITTADHLSEVNASVAKLTAFKKEIASAISDMGVATAENADATTMSNNIRSLSEASSTNKVSYGTINGGSSVTGLEFTPTLVCIFGSYYVGGAQENILAVSGWHYIFTWNTSINIGDGTNDGITIFEDGFSFAGGYPNQTYEWIAI